MHNDDYSERLGRMISKTNDSGAQEGRQLETGERPPEQKQEETMKRGSIFELNGVPKFQEAIPLALQHVVAMIVGCVTPAIIVAGAVGGGGLSAKDRVILIQASLVISALSTLIQLFPLGKKGGFTLGSGLPMIMGVSFAYVPSMQAIAEGYGISTILGAQIVGGVVAFIMGILVKKIRVFFPPLITGTVVFTIGLSLYPTAINYMAGGTSNPDYGSWQNWLVAFITLAVVTALNHFGKGILKLASILIGIIVGYIVSIPFGMVNLSSVGQAKMFQLPQFMHFGIHFEISACVAIGLLFAINSVQAIGDYSATTIGAMDRVPEDRELQNGIMAYGISNVIGALFGGLPTATYSQNVGIVGATKVVSRKVFSLSAFILLIAGLIPKFSALLRTIPQCVLGGAVASVFAGIAMTGIKLLVSEGMSTRNTTVAGLSIAIGMGVSLSSGCLNQMTSTIYDGLGMTMGLENFQSIINNTFASSPVVLATIFAVILNLVLPKDPKPEAK